MKKKKLNSVQKAMIEEKKRERKVMIAFALIALAAVLVSNYCQYHL